MAFSAGDVVKLKSGGPDMTVKFSIGKAVHCIWFILLNEASKNYSELQKETFEYDAIEKIK